MRCVVLIVVVCAVVPRARADQPQGKAPNAEQLQTAQDTFARLGAVYRAELDPWTKQTIHIFTMPKATSNADLQALPSPPFAFRLSMPTPG
jgi:hypothetical protein